VLKDWKSQEGEERTISSWMTTKLYWWCSIALWILPKNFIPIIKRQPKTL